MEKIATKLTDLLIENNVINNSMYEIYQYGFLRMLEIGGAFLTGVVICFGMGMLKEGVIFLIFFAPLRSYLGGIHLKNYWQCYILSCLVLTLVLLITKYVTFNPYITCGLIMLGTIGMGIEAYKEYRRQRNKVYSIIICAVLSVILLVSFFCFKGGYDSILVLLSCIVILVFISKLIEQLRNRLYYHKV